MSLETLGAPRPKDNTNFTPSRGLEMDGLQQSDVARPERSCSRPLRTLDTRYPPNMLGLSLAGEFEVAMLVEPPD